MKIEVAQCFANNQEVYFDAGSNEFKKLSDLEAGVAAVATKVFGLSGDLSVQNRFLSEIDTAFAGVNRR